MTVQLLRIEAERYLPGQAIEGNNNVSWHLTRQKYHVVWASRKGDTLQTAELTPHRITFREEAIFMRFYGFGLEYDGVFQGDFDHAVSLYTIPQLLGDAYKPIVDIVRANLTSGVDTFVMVCAIDMVDVGNTIKCEFLGVLPLDKNLISNVLLTPFNAAVRP